MRRIAIRLTTVALTALGSSDMGAQQTVVTQIGYVFPAISRMSMSVGQALTLRHASNGTPAFVGTAATTYAVATNESNRKIVAQLDADMPPGITLSANLAAPIGGSSAGAVTLSSAAADVVTGITTVSETDLPMNYTVSARSTQTMPSARRTVVFTIIAGM